MDEMQEKLRRIEIRCFGEDDELLMASSYDVDTLRAQREAVSVDVEMLPVDEPFNVSSSFTPTLKTLRVRMPLLSGEVRLGPSAHELVLCRWDADAEKFVPVFAPVPAQ